MKLLIIVCLMLCIAAPIAAQLPPTPTPQPPGVAKFDLPESFSLWAGASTAIQFWNWVGDGQVIVQGLAIIGLIIAGVFIVWRFFSKMTTRDSES